MIKAAGDKLRGYSIGDTIARRYRVIEVLGRGGMGVVYKVENVDPKNEGERYYAIKHIHPSLQHSDYQLYDWLINLQSRESLIGALLGRHNNIVKTIAFLPTAPVPVLVLEFVNGKSLHSIIESETPRFLAIPEVLRVALQVCEAFLFVSNPQLNRGSIVHRDLDPRNVMLTRKGIVKISDWGLAREMGSDDAWIGDTILGQVEGIDEILHSEEPLSIEKEEEILRRNFGEISKRRGPGKFMYMPPEQFLRGAEYCVSGDIFAFCVTLYEMLGGYWPLGKADGSTFRRYNENELVLHQITHKPAHFKLLAQRAQELRLDIPARFVSIVDKGLCRCPGLRWQKFQEIYEELLKLKEEFISGKVPLQQHFVCQHCSFIAAQDLAVCPCCDSQKSFMKWDVTDWQDTVAQDVAEQEDKPEIQSSVKEERTAEKSPLVGGFPDSEVIQSLESFVYIPAGLFIRGVNSAVLRRLMPAANQREQAHEPSLFDFMRRLIAAVREFGLGSTAIQAALHPPPPPAEIRRLDLSPLTEPEIEEVQLDAYYISQTPVTNHAYWEFIKDTGWPRPPHWHGHGEQPFAAELANHPVTHIAFLDAEAYCEWHGGRLPSNDEWEKASRGSDARPYPWGEEFSPLNCNCAEAGIGNTTQVTAHPEGISPYGVLDLVGNTGDLVDGGQGSFKDVRGGSYVLPCEYYGLTWARLFKLDREQKCDSVGFRVTADPNGLVSLEQLSEDISDKVEFIHVKYKEALIGCEPALLREMAERYPLGDSLRHELENDRLRTVSMKPFDISRHPITNWQYWNYLAERTTAIDLPVRPRNWLADKERLLALVKMRSKVNRINQALSKVQVEHSPHKENALRNGELATFPLLLRYANHPVVGITHQEAVNYCEWHSKKTGRPCRLPSWEEWQVAARGDDGRAYPWGSSFDPTKCNYYESGYGRTVDVREFPQGVSPAGCEQMSGNVFEWLALSDHGELGFCGGSYLSAVEVYGLTFLKMRTDSSYENHDLGFRVVREHI